MPLPTSLRPSRTGNQPGEPLFNLLQKIYTERGHLRDVTEQSLEKQISSSVLQYDLSPGSSENEEEAAAAAAGEPARDVDSRAKELQTARSEILQLIGQANNEALTALDFVSLLLSKDARPAEASISPALKSMAPAGTLGFDKTDVSSLTRSDEALERKITLGFSYNSLNYAANRLLASATRLEEEISRETKYWEQILSLNNDGWNLCRVPGQSHTVGIRFGFSEASPQFRARGLAALRSDDEGDIILDHAVIAEQKMLRVRILDGEEVVDVSTNASTAPSDNNSLNLNVKNARDSLFDEELFFQLLLNARDLFSYDVRVMDSQIILPFHTDSLPHRKIVVDLVSGNHIDSITQSIAESCVLGLRLSLSNLYRIRHQYRSLPPPPLTVESRQTQESNLLLPFLCQIQHYARVTELRDSLLVLSKTMRSSKLDCAITVRPEFAHQLVLAERAEDQDHELTPNDIIFQIWNGSLSTKMQINLPNSFNLSIELSTDLAPPTYGTEYRLHHSKESSFNQSTRMLFSDYEELMLYLHVLACQSIAAYLSANLPNGTLDADRTGVQVSTRGGRETLVVSMLRDSMALSAHYDVLNNTNTLLGIWRGKRQKYGVLEVATQRLNN